MWPLMWLNRSIVTINATLQLIYIYIYINRLEFIISKGNQNSEFI